MFHVAISLYIVGCSLQVILGIPVHDARRWSYMEDDGTIVDVMSAKKVNRNVASLNRNERCTCFCKRKWSRQWNCCSCEQKTCFPASSSVTLETGEVMGVAELQPGDRVLTADLTGKILPTTVLGYLDRHRDVISRYHVIKTASGSQLSLSGSHLVYVSTENSTAQALPRYASDVNPGDYVIIREGNEAVVSMVTNIFVQGMKGAFVPLTEEGTIIVDNVLTSCYASFHHEIAHVAMVPLRYFPSLVTMTPQNGAHPYVTFMKTVGRTILPRSWLFKDPEQVTVLNKTELHSRNKIAGHLTSDL